MTQDFEKDKTYIVKSKSGTSVRKMKVIELTQTSMLVKWENANQPYRYEREIFDFRIIEKIDELEDYIIPYKDGKYLNF